MFDLPLEIWQMVLREKAPHSRAMLELLKLDPSDEEKADELEERMWETAQSLIVRLTPDPDLQYHLQGAVCSQLGQLMEREAILKFQRSHPQYAEAVREVADVDEAYRMWLLDRMEPEDSRTLPLARRVYSRLKTMMDQDSLPERS